MNSEIFLEIIQYCGVLLLGGISLYLTYSQKAQEKAKQVQEVLSTVTAKAVIFIKEAEEKYKDTTNMGGTKFNEVVDRLYDLTPTPLQMIITREMIAEIVQSTFDQIEEYVKLQLDKKIK